MRVAGIKSGRVLGGVSEGRLAVYRKEGFLLPRVLYNLGVAILRTSFRLTYDTIPATKCRVFVRTQVGPGPYVQYNFVSVLETSHSHIIAGLIQGTVYEAYIQVFDSGSYVGYYPTDDPVNHGHLIIQTATDSDPGGWLREDGF